MDAVAGTAVGAAAGAATVAGAVNNIVTVVIAGAAGSDGEAMRNTRANAAT